MPIEAPPPPPVIGWSPAPVPPAPSESLELDSAGALGPLVQNLREARGLSRAELAQRCGVGPRFIFDLERGKPTLRLDKLLAVLRVLGVRLLAHGR